MSKRITWRKFHKWGGLITALFILVFCVSGIILNHRALFSDSNVSRSLLPGDYHLDKFNNGIIKGTVALGSDSVLAYGGAGVWLTNSRFTDFRDFNSGLPKGIDRRTIRNIVRMPDGTLWTAAQFGLYRFRNGKWEEVALDGNDERLSDLTISPDSASLVALSRSKAFVVNPVTGASEAHLLDTPEGRKPQTTLFKTFWMLHSGELFGTAGRIVVDIVAVIIIFLCITGIIVFCLPYRFKWIAKRRLRKPAVATLNFFKANLKLHDKVGYITAVVTIIVAFTGMCLRPPLMIPLVMTKTAPLPGSALDTDNYWHDKLRAIRWDDESGKWLLSTSEGFVRVNADFSGVPASVEASVTPPVSPMGITAFEKTAPGTWLVGSFSGLYLWDMNTGSAKDLTTGKEYDPSVRIYGTGSALVSGVSRDLEADDLVTFDYAAGAPSLPEMSDELRSQPISLWNCALELHVGRCYTPFMGPFSQLFVFVFGLLLTLILISGVIIHVRNNRKKNNKKLNINNKTYPK